MYFCAEPGGGGFITRYDYYSIMITHSLRNSIMILCDVTRYGIDIYDFILKKRMTAYDVRRKTKGALNALNALRDIGRWHVAGIACANM